jgi:hypothetical protein
VTCEIPNKVTALACLSDGVIAFGLECGALEVGLFSESSSAQPKISRVSLGDSAVTSVSSSLLRDDALCQHATAVIAATTTASPGSCLHICRVTWASSGNGFQLQQATLAHLAATTLCHAALAVDISSEASHVAIVVPSDSLEVYELSDTLRRMFDVETPVTSPGGVQGPVWPIGSPGAEGSDLNAQQSLAGNLLHLTLHPTSFTSGEALSNTAQDPKTVQSDLLPVGCVPAAYIYWQHLSLTPAVHHCLSPLNRQDNQPKLRALFFHGRSSCKLYGVPFPAAGMGQTTSADKVACPHLAASIAYKSPCPITSSVASADTRCLLLLLATGFIVVFDTWTGCVRCISSRPVSTVSCINFVQTAERKHDGLIVGVSATGSAVTWSLEGGSIRSCTCGTRGVLPSAVSVHALGSGAHLLVCTRDGHFLLYDFASDVVVAAFQHSAGRMATTSTLLSVMALDSVCNPETISCNRVGVSRARS